MNMYRFLYLLQNGYLIGDSIRKRGTDSDVASHDLKSSSREWPSDFAKSGREELRRTVRERVSYGRKDNVIPFKTKKEI